MEVYSLNLKLENGEELKIKKIYSRIPSLGEKIPFDLSYEEFEQVNVEFLDETNSISKEELRNCYGKFFTKNYLVKNIENPVSKGDKVSVLEGKVIVYAEEI